ncbi:MAG: UDP-N-acetylmuramoyl-tripeptide--D-alanyl-D-alanine ligase [Clostridiales bacterium]|jgi:UDP-N-acetylmuramoyl-tripeptide--D-alanyl-D-alanine ligase|nr:UDP-N-acetylmuramoyl-tripeptide--D-alanyl-D-alanine ligase [Clostridiales bacterium]
MKNMTLNNIAKACKGKLFNNGSAYESNVKGIVIDSRLVSEDFLFIATRGEKVNGHDFIESAIRLGAMAVVCEKTPTNISIPYILVDDSLVALKDIATWYRMQLNIPVVGITGSVGKTSTKEFVSSVLSRRYSVLKTEGNYNNEIGLPLTILQIRKRHEIAVLEMGISNFGEMHRLSKIAKPNYCLITNIGQCHLEQLGSREGILRAKSEIFDFMSEDGGVILNGDDDMLSAIHDVRGITPIRYGLGLDNDVYADNIISKNLSGSSYTLHFMGEALSINSSMPGNHMILNALAAATLGRILGLTGKEITDGIEQIQPVSGRNNIIYKENWTIIDDCYNANPVSMKAAIDLLDMADTRKVAILGDMGELGKSEVQLHKEIGKYIGSKNVDIIICVGKLSKHMYEGAMELLSDTSKVLFHFDTRDELIKALPDLLKNGDTILVKASHFMGFDNIVNLLGKSKN